VSGERTLSRRLESIAATLPREDRERTLAALRIGAELALSRLTEVGGMYSTKSDIEVVRDELLPSTGTAKVPIAAPTPPDTPLQEQEL
jgi:hypothetical protein